MFCLRVLVVDDAAVYRKVMRELLATVPGVEVVGTASNGRLALDAIESLKPDLLILDFEMPELDGIGLLRELRNRRLSTAAIMVCSLTSKDAAMTTQALSLGAFDFAIKPTTDNLAESLVALRNELLPKVDAFRIAHDRHTGNEEVARPIVAAMPSESIQPAIAERADIVAIGVSTGGPAALASLLPKLPADLSVPIVIVQHMPPIFTKSLADDLNRTCQLQVLEARDGDEVVPGRILIAPGGKQMKVQRSANGVSVRITDDGPERSCKPSIDYLFRSVSQVYGKRTLGIILTGMGDDGTIGCRAIKNLGGIVVAQDQASCVVYGMPRHIVDEGLADAVSPLTSIHSHIRRLSQQPVLCP